jgi:hydrogenase/urease accessory protein HupE
MFFPVLTKAHEIRPAYLEIKENRDHSLEILWKQPLMGDYGVPLHPSISAGWMEDSLAQIAYTETFLVKRWHIAPGHARLNGQTVAIDGLEKTITDVLMQVIPLNGPSYTWLIKPINPSAKIEILKPQAPPIWQYIQLGVHHIMSGFDHLLFVFALVLLVRKRSTLVWTITAFTIAHSMTLALATLNIVRVPGAFTEAAIALSIVFLAVELVNHYRGSNGLAYHYPWLVSFAFGLLHGFGFASALQDVGLPQYHIPIALFLFNLGVEIGQLLFVSLMLLLMASNNKLNYRERPWHKYLAPYGIGSMAVFWMIERIVMIVNP